MILSALLTLLLVPAPIDSEVRIGSALRQGTRHQTDESAFDAFPAKRIASVNGPGSFTVYNLEILSANAYSTSSLGVHIHNASAPIPSGNIYVPRQFSVSLFPFALLPAAQAKLQHANGTEIVLPVIFDMGAPRSVISWEAARDLGLNVTNRKEVMMSHGIKIEIGETVLPRLRISHDDLTINDDLVVEELPLEVMKIPGLIPFLVGLDIVQGRLSITPSAVRSGPVRGEILRLDSPERERTAHCSGPIASRAGTRPPFRGFFCC